MTIRETQNARPVNPTQGPERRPTAAARPSMAGDCVQTSGRAPHIDYDPMLDGHHVSNWIEQLHGKAHQPGYFTRAISDAELRAQIALSLIHI